MSTKRLHVGFMWYHILAINGKTVPKRGTFLSFYYQKRDHLEIMWYLLWFKWYHLER